MNMKAVREAEDIENTLLHFPKGISKDIHNYVIETVFKEHRYIFTTRVGRKQRAFCTYCKADYETEGLKHKEEATCQGCESTCTVQSAGYSRSKMIDVAYFVYYDKSEVNPEAIIARGFNVQMDYSGDYKNVMPDYEIKGKYLFEIGNPVFLKRNFYRESGYEKRKSVFSLYRQGQGGYNWWVEYNEKTSLESIVDAVEGTPYQYSTWDEYRFYDYVEFFEFASKYQSVEYMTKLGFKSFVEKRLTGKSINNTINWRGKTIDKVLRIDKQDMKTAIKHSYLIDEWVLYIYQLSRRDGSNFSLLDAIEITEHGLHREYSAIKKILKKMSFRRLMNYLKRQSERESRNRGIYSLSQILITLSDYWDGCEKLGLNIGDDMPEFPSDLYAAHDNINSQVEYKESAELNKKIEKRKKALSILEYENDLFILRPFSSSEEIIDEGKVLNHCIGGYTKRYANSETDIFAIRRKKDPESPFYTLEVKDGEVRQFYGYKNNREYKKPKKVIEFVEEFEQVKLKNTKELAI